MPRETISLTILWKSVASESLMCVQPSVSEPFVSAKDHPVGTQMRGQDGDMYVVRIWEKGNGKPQMWFRLENADKNNAVPYKVIRKRTQMMEEKKIWQ